MRACTTRALPLPIALSAIAPRCNSVVSRLHKVRQRAARDRLTLGEDTHTFGPEAKYRPSNLTEAVTQQAPGWADLRLSAAIDAAAPLEVAQPRQRIAALIASMAHVLASNCVPHRSLPPLGRC